MINAWVLSSSNCEDMIDDRKHMQTLFKEAQICLRYLLMSVT